MALGTVIKDFENPDVLIIGESNSRYGDIAEKIYSKILKNNVFFVSKNEKAFYICIRIQRISDETSGEMAEWSNAAVLKTVDCNRSGGSNPSFSAKGNPQLVLWVFCFQKCRYYFKIRDAF